ncbi:MAG: type VI secretion system lipoprotein TssJ [Pseudomonadota bacterium]
MQRTSTGRMAHIVPCVALALAITACAEPPPAPTGVALALATTAEMNGGNPAKVQVFYLTSDANFLAADYFSLINEPGATLGQDLVAVDEFLMAPGDTAEDTKTFDLAVPYIGAVVGLREIDQPGWRALSEMTPRAPNAVALTVGGDGATFEAVAQ